MSCDVLERHRLVSGAVLVIDDNTMQVNAIRKALEIEHDVLLPESGMAAAPDVAVVSVTAKAFDGFRVIARMRASEATRHLPILAVVEPDDREGAVRALALGAHDIASRPIDHDEIVARMRTLMRRKHYVDALRARLDQSLELAITDQLTGLYNRRFLSAQLPALTQRAQCGGDPVSLMAIDLDHFKHCNDSYGHDAGDDILRDFAVRLASNLRPSDFACRMGGEEFVVIMPRTPGDIACMAAERLRRNICATPFRMRGVAQTLDITVSIGVACAETGDDVETLLKRADEALYEAKRAGRNRVIGKTVSHAA